MNIYMSCVYLSFTYPACILYLPSFYVETFTPRYQPNTIHKYPSILLLYNLPKVDVGKYIQVAGYTNILVAHDRR